MTPIIKATKTLPKYFHNLPQDEFKLKYDEEKYFISDSVSTLRSCYGFLEYFKKAITICHWTDLFLEISKEQYKFYSAFTLPEEHLKEQIGHGFKNYHHIKLASPWRFREKSGIQFAWIGAEWNLEEFNFKILPGIINFSINCYTNINIMLPKEEKSYVIPAGLPLVNLIPLTDKKIEIKNHLVTVEEMNSISGNNPNSVYFHGWRTAQKLLRNNTKKCPF